MADVSDVESVLVSTLAQIIYPSGTGQPSILSSPCKIYRGWPVPANLDADLKNGVINVSVFPQANEQKTTRYMRRWQPLPHTKPQLQLIVGGNTVTVVGTPSSPLNAAIIVNGIGYVYAVQPNDTTISIATALAASINANTPATSNGDVISIADAIAPNSPMSLSVSGPLSRRFGGTILSSLAGFWPDNSLHFSLSGPWRKRFGGAILASESSYFPTPQLHLAARVGAVIPVVREIRRQKRGFQISFWCSTPAQRDAIASACDNALAAIDYLTMPDGTAVRFLYERTSISDNAELENIYRRDLFYSAEYGTTQTGSAAQIVTQIFELSGGSYQACSPTKTFSI